MGIVAPNMLLLLDRSLEILVMYACIQLSQFENPYNVLGTFCLGLV